MSEENVEVIRAAFAAYASGDIPTMLQSIDTDAISQRWPPLPDPVTYRGREGFLQLIADWIKDFAQFDTDIEEYIDANDRQVVTRVSQRAVGAHSGVRVEAEFWFVWTLQSELLKRLDLYMTKAQALEAAGLSE